MSSNKSFSSETSERYALALFELSNENTELDSVEKSAKELLELFNSSVDFKDFVNNPTQSRNTQLKVIEEISDQMNFGKNLKKFMSILVLKRRIFFLEKIIKSFLSLISKKRGELNATLISSKNLNSEELKKLNKELTKTIGSQINFDFKIDENLIGGFKLQLGSLMIDTSLQNRLKKYEQKMLEV